MAKSSNYKRAPLALWETESLRTTVFPSPDAPIESQNWWTSVVGESPETEVARVKIGERQIQGVYHGARLTLRIQPARIDWSLTSIPSPEPPEDFPTVGRFEETCGYFRELMERWLPMSPPVNRIALGGIFVLPVETLTDGYKQLAAYLPAVKLDVDGSSDFLYRINRRRTSKTGIQNLQLNRLSTWSVVSMEILTLGPGGTMKAIRGGSPSFACRVELDINTMAEFEEELNPQQSMKIFKELVGTAGEILDKGEIP